MPRAALLSIHARVQNTQSDVLDDPSLVQLWGPRYNVYVVAERDREIFSVGRFPQAGKARDRAVGLATRLGEFLGEDEVPFGEAGRALGVHHNALRYAATTGRVLLRWDGARQPTIRLTEVPDLEPEQARLELAKRYLHVFGPGTADSFRAWAGIEREAAATAFERLGRSTTPVRTPIGDATILRGDEVHFRDPTSTDEAVRLLPSGDAYYLLHDEAQRSLLVRDARRRDLLWTSRVWPGALLVDGEIVGTWRRSKTTVSIAPWKRLTRATRARVEEESIALPLPDDGEIRVEWVVD